MILSQNSLYPAVGEPNRGFLSFIPGISGFKVQRMQFICSIMEKLFSEGEIKPIQEPPSGVKTALKNKKEIYA